LAEEVGGKENHIIRGFYHERERNSMDVTIGVNYKQSEINGLFNEIEELKKERANLKEVIDSKTDRIIKHILQNGNVLAYKDNEAHVLIVKNRTTKLFDKSQLAVDTDRSPRDLNLIGVAELIEERRTSSVRLKDYQYEESKQVLKARKAKKSDIELLSRRS